MTLSNGIIILHKLTMKHFKDFKNIINDPEIAQYLSIPYPIKTKWTKEYIQTSMDKFKNKEKFTWGIFKTNTDKFIGVITLKDIDYKNKIAKIGYSIGRSHWNNGYTLMAVKMALKYAFTEIKLNRIEIYVNYTDEKSKKLLKELEAKLEGKMEEAFFYKNKHHDILLYAVLKNRFKLK